MEFKFKCPKCFKTQNVDQLTKNGDIVCLFCENLMHFVKVNFKISKRILAKYALIRIHLKIHLSIVQIVAAKILHKNLKKDMNAMSALKYFMFVMREN